MPKVSKSALYDKRWRRKHRAKSHYCNYRSEARRFALFAKPEDLEKVIQYYKNQYQRRFN